MTDKGKGSIRILHLSDLHVKEDTNDLRREIQALENDLKENYDAIDYIVITGDLTFSGKKEQFDVIATRLIPRLKAIAKVNPRNIIVVPGNHDIDRDLVPSIQKSGIKSLVEMKDADAFVSDIISSAGFDAYRGFIKGLQLMKAAETDEVFCRYTSSMAREFSGKIYFACFNTAWTCIDDRNKGEICLSKKQLEYGSSMGSDVNIRIAVMHHGLDWLHEMDAPLVTRIQNSFDLVITGHVHRDSSVVQITPQTQIVILTGTCFCGDDSAKYHGYNVYDIDTVNGCVNIYYRKYIADDQRFAENVDYAPHGRGVIEWKTITPMAVMPRERGLAYLYQSTRKDDKIIMQLKRMQGLDSPVYMPPVLDAVTVKDGELFRQSIPAEALENKNTLLYAPREYGKTIFLEKLSLELTDHIYIDCADVIRDGSNAAEYFFGLWRQKFCGDLIDGYFLLIDHARIDDSSELQVLVDTLSEFGKFKGLIVSTSSEYLFESSVRNKGLSTFYKVEIRPWGVKTIEAFSQKYWEKKYPGKEPQIEYLKTCLAHSDVPLTPVSIGVYVSLFAITSFKSSSASIVNLIDRLADIKFGAERYNCIELLLMLACRLYDAKSDRISKWDVMKLISEYYESKNLDYVIDDVYERLVCSQFIIEDDYSYVRFAYYVLKDYFIALAAYKCKIDIDTLTDTDVAVLANAGSLILYGSIARDNESILGKLFERLLDVCGHEVGRAFDFSQLDDFIAFLYYPPAKSVEEERQFIDEKRKQLDRYKVLQKEFEDSRNRHAEFRKKSQVIQEAYNQDVVGSYADKVIMLLRTFYNLYRNLETIDAEKKEGYLDLILEFHIYCNLMLIQSFRDIFKDREFSSIIAYVVTISGQSFMRQELLAPSLRKTILKCIGREQNDFKKFLLVSLYADGKFDGYEKLLQDFATDTTSYSAIEMIYHKVRYLLVICQEIEIPDKLMKLFKHVLDKRAQIYKRKTKDISQEVDVVKKRHIENYHWGDKKLV